MSHWKDFLKATVEDPLSWKTVSRKKTSPKPAKMSHSEPQPPRHFNSTEAPLTPAPVAETKTGMAQLNISEEETRRAIESIQGLSSGQPNAYEDPNIDKFQKLAAGLARAAASTSGPKPMDTSDSASQLMQQQIQHQRQQQQNLQTLLQVQHELPDFNLDQANHLIMKDPNTGEFKRHPVDAFIGSCQVQTFDPYIFASNCDASLVTKKGFIFNILNNQAHGTAQYVKMLRIDLDDPKYLCRYLLNNHSMLKACAAALVHQYFLQMRVNLGINGPITVDDYAASYTIASLSDEGRAALPNGEVEGPIQFCVLDNLLQKTRFRKLPDGTWDESLVINFRIHQVNHNVRIPPAGEKKKPVTYTTVYDPASKKPYNSLAPRTTATTGPPPIKIPKVVKGRAPEPEKVLAEDFRKLEDRLKKMEREAASHNQCVATYPQLPEPAAWPPEEGHVGLPDSF